MTDHTTTEPVPVTQADQDLFVRLFAIPPSRAHGVYDGSRDDTAEMQAIARHRLNHAAPAVERAGVEAGALAIVRDLARIRSDLADFDGDKRGHWGALEDAMERLDDYVRLNAAALSLPQQQPGTEGAEASDGR